MTTNDSVTRNRAALGLLAIAGSTSVVLFNWRSPHIRLEPSYLNNLVFAAACIAPWFALLLVRPFQHLAVRVILRTWAIGAGLVLLPLALGSLLLDMGSSRPVLGSIDTGRYTVRLYETNCGAVCSYGVAVWQENRPVPGILLVRDLGGFYPANAPSYTVIRPDSIRVDVPAYGGRAPARFREYRLHDLP